MSPTRQTIIAHYPTRRVVLASCRTASGSLSLFVPTTDPIPAGSAVRLRVTFGDVSEVFELDGTVTWRRAQARGLGLEPGLGVEFASSEKFRAAQMLAFCAGRPLAHGTACERRVAAKVPCLVRVGRHRVTGQIRDLSSSGAFVGGASLARLPQGTELCIQLSKGWLGFGVRELKARVVWSGNKNGVLGFGARFMDDATRTRPILRKYLAAGAPAR